MSGALDSLPVDPVMEAKAMLQADPDRALALFYALGHRLSTAEFPELVVETVTDDGETYMGVRCPRCESLLGDVDEGIQVVDWGTWTTTAEEVDPDARTHTMHYDHEPEMNTLHYQCGQCEEAVSLPADWRED